MTTWVALSNLQRQVIHAAGDVAAESR